MFFAYLSNNCLKRKKILSNPYKTFGAEILYKYNELTYATKMAWNADSVILMWAENMQLNYLKGKKPTINNYMI